MEPVAQQQQVPYKSVEVVAPTELATHLRVLKSAGGGEARLQLHPAELGRMTIGLITEGEDARVTFIVDSVQAKQAVESSLPRLRDLLEEAGFTLSDSDVSQRGSAHDRENEADHMLDDEAIDSEQDTITAHEGAPSSTHLIDAFA
jgi:flagellar hook-length control protein FliK